ncbi:MAG: polyphosphate kinase 2, partial [Thiomonas sp.]
KMSPIDAVAQKHWKDYSVARNAMFARTHTLAAPWTIVRANDKKLARLNLIMDLLTRLEYQDKNHAVLVPDPELVFNYTQDAVTQGRVAP